MQVSSDEVSLYSLYYVEVCNDVGGAHLRIAPGQHSTFRKNVAAVASH